MNALPLEGGFHVGPLFIVVKTKAAKAPGGRRRSTFRSRQERRATPAWVDLVAMESMYAEARRLTLATGELHVVDHIVPLRGKIVSGLHWHGNMRVIHWRPNASKGALEWPDMPMEQMDLF